MVAGLHLAVLWTFAIAKPLFDVLADEPAFFVARGNTSADIIIFAVGLVFLPPLALVGIEAAFVRWDRVRRGLHTLFIGGLVAVFALQLLSDTISSTPVLAIVAALLGAAGAAVYVRASGVRSTLTVLSPATLIFLALFLLFSPVSDLVLPQDESSASTTSIKGDTPVVMVVFDEFPNTYLLDREGRIDRTRFPNLARLARDSTWYRNATTVADVTTQAVPAILTGKRSVHGSLPTLSDHPDNLFTLLGKSYRLDVRESVTKMCPTNLCGNRDKSSASSRLRSLVEDLSLVSMHQLAPDDLDHRIPAVDRTFGGFRGGGGSTTGGVAGGGADAGIPDQHLFDRKRIFEQFLSEIGRPGTRPPLNFIHAQLPHYPWLYLPSGQRYPVSGSDDAPGLDGETWTKDPRPVRQNLERELLQDGFVDHLVGQLVERLQRTGLWKRSLVIVTADHGIAFRPGLSRRYISPGIFGEIANVPLFIKAPGQQTGRTDNSDTRTIDIVPTIAHELGVKLPWKADGVPAGERKTGDGDPIDIEAFTGGDVTLPFGEFKRLRDTTAREVGALSSAGLGSFLSFGPRLDLLNRPVSAFPASPRVDATMELDAPSLFESVSPRSSAVPSYVTGRLTGPSAGPMALAIAVNGRVRALTDSYLMDGEYRFGAMVPPASFRKGRNAITAFALDTDGSGARLAALGAGGTAKLVERDGGEVVVLPTGRQVPLTGEGMTGFIDRLTYHGNQLNVTGWAVDTKRRRAPDQILVFGDGGLLVAGRPSVDRPDIAARFGEGAKRSGFLASALTDQAKTLADPKKLRVVAVAGGRAMVLGVSGGATIGRGQ